MKQKKSFKQAMRLFMAMSLIFVACIVSTRAQTGIFTYQGRLTDANNPSGSGTYQMQFAVYDSPTGGDLLGTVTINNVPVTNGVFTVQLDANAFMNFSGSGVRYLEVRVFNAATNQYVTLAPRQQITSAPFAIKAQSAAIADVSLNTQAVGGIAAANIIKEGDARLSDARTPAAGSTNYIQNQNAAAQASTNFNISGNGTLGGTLSAKIVNAGTQFNLNGNRILSNLGTNNLFAGVSAGASSIAGGGNSFFGYSAGRDIETGSDNSFFGMEAGLRNIGSENSFFGKGAGAGKLNAVNNGSRNSFFGTGAGNNNVFGSDNSFFGISAGNGNTGGSNNVFIGSSAGAANNTGSGNTALGANANVASGNLSFSSAIGANAVVSSSDSIVIGKVAGTYNGVQRPADQVQVPGNLTASGTIATQSQYNIAGSRVLGVAGSDNLFVGLGAGTNNSTGYSNSFIGTYAGLDNTTGSDNSFVGMLAGRINKTGNKNSFFGAGAGINNTTGSNNTIIGMNADVGAGDLNFATAVGSNAVVSTSDTIVIGKAAGTYNGIARPADTVKIPGNLELGLDLRVGKLLAVNTLGISGDQPLCRSSSNQVISFCSSSLRYKTNLAPFSEGLSFVRQLQPISYDWKTGGRRDVGFGAEDVAKINPLFVTYNPQGEVEGVKYDRLSVAFVNAFREQQAQIEARQAENQSLKTQVERQQKQINELKQIVCALKPDAAICTEDK